MKVGVPQVGEVTCGGLPHLSCKCDHIKGLFFAWSGGPRSSGVGFFCFHSLGTQNKRNLPH